MPSKMNSKITYKASWWFDNAGFMVKFIVQNRVLFNEVIFHKYI